MFVYNWKCLSTTDILPTPAPNGATPPRGRGIGEIKLNEKLDKAIGINGYVGRICRNVIVSIDLNRWDCL